MLPTAKKGNLLDILDKYDYKHSTTLPASLGNAAAKGKTLITEDENRVVDMRQLEFVNVETQHLFFPEGIKESYNKKVIVLYVRDDIKTILYDAEKYKGKYHRLGDETTITEWLNIG